MKVQTLEKLFLSRFRNLSTQELEFSPRVNLFLGENGQGKTNLLEAIFFLSFLRPLRGNNSEEAIAWGEKSALIRGHMKANGLDSTLEVRLEGKKKQVVADGKTKSLFEAVGLLQVVVFSPDDLDIIKGAPEIRRKFLDRAAFAKNREHLKNLFLFRRALRQRNKLLAGGSSAELDAFSRQLAHFGAQVTSAREEIVARLSEELQKLSGGEVDLRFRQGWPESNGEREESLLRALASSLEKDRVAGYTGYGPQRDRLEILFRSRPAMLSASQGQKRLCAMMIMLSLIELLKKMEDQPIVLLDDISSELDRANRIAILEKVVAVGGQVFITSTEFSDIEILGEQTVVFDVSCGKVVRSR